LQIGYDKQGRTTGERKKNADLDSYQLGLDQKEFQRNAVAILEEKKGGKANLKKKEDQL